MGLELLGALAIGGLVLWLVFQPVLAPGRSGPPLAEPEVPEETRRGVALLALKEIEFLGHTQAGDLDARILGLTLSQVERL